jgi:thioredoxin 1
MIVELEDNLEAIQTGNVLVDFYTTTCGPCKRLAPVLEELSQSQEFSSIKIAKMEVTKNPMASQMFGVMSVPTLMFLKNLQVKEVSYGFSNKGAIESMMRRHISNGHG